MGLPRARKRFKVDLEILKAGAFRQRPQEQTWAVAKIAATLGTCIRAACVGNRVQVLSWGHGGVTQDVTRIAIEERVVMSTPKLRRMLPNALCLDRDVALKTQLQGMSPAVFLQLETLDANQLYNLAAASILAFTHAFPFSRFD